MSKIDYTIEEVDLRSDTMIEQFPNVTEESIGRPETAERAYLNTYIESRGFRSLYLAALKDGELLGFNAFIAHQLLWKGEFIPAYQSCWTFTSPRQRGKRVFTNIIEEAKRILRDRGAAIIFGGANINSHPIFTQKLGFSDRGGFLRCNVPAYRAIARRSLSRNPDAFSTELNDGLSQNNAELLLLKRRQVPVKDYVDLADPTTNSAWGKIRVVRRYGMKLRYLYIGGLNVSNPSHLGDLVETAIDRFRVHVIQFVFHHTAAYRLLFRNSKDSPTVSPLITYGLNVDEREIESFGFFTGLYDVF